MSEKKTLPPGVCEIRTYTNGRRTVVGLHPRIEGPLGILTNPTPLMIFTQAQRGQVGFQVPLTADTPEAALNMPDDEWEGAINTTFEMIRQKMSLANPGILAPGRPR